MNVNLSDCGVVVFRFFPEVHSDSWDKVGTRCHHVAVCDCRRRAMHGEDERSHVSRAVRFANV